MSSLHTPAAQADAALPLAAGTAAPHTIRFPRGLPGFEGCRSFVLMSPEGDGPLQYLKCVDGPRASFLVIDPRRVDPTFRCELGAPDRLALGLKDDTTALWLCLVTVEEDGTMAVNLRAPLVIDPARMTGQQIIPHQSTRPLRHVLVEGG